MCVGGQPRAKSYCAIAVAVAWDVSDPRRDDRLLGLEFLCPGGSALTFQSQRFSMGGVEMGLRRGEMRTLSDLSIGRA